jgi:PPM family protein phosphatase
MNTFFSKCVAQGPRDNLEDCCNCLEIANPTDPENSVTVAVVADGVGGHCRGEWASQLAVTHIMSSLAESIIGWMSTGTILDLNQIAQQAFDTANQAILQEIRNHPEWTGMSTTAVCTLRYRNTLITAWAGDSRAYLFHLGELTRLTKDHKATTPLMAEGLLNPQDERRHPLYHTICQYLGMPEQFQIDLHACHLAYGDIVLLCSDGLTDVISDEEIGAVMVRYNEGQFSLKRLAHYLVELALDSWTRDNVTVLCGEYLPNPPSHSWNETLTGAYPDQVAKILHHSIKEYSNANHQ